MVPSFGQDRLADYLAGTEGSPPRAQLVRAIEHHRRFRPSSPAAACTALDVGCGPGREVCELLRAGFDVLAIDAYERMVEETESVARGLAGRLGRRLEVRQGLVEHGPWSGTATPFELIHAGFVLPFVPDESFPQTLSGLASVLASGGILVAQLFGPDDSFIRESPVGSMNCHRAAEIPRLLKLLGGLEILEYEEVNRAGFIGRGKPKWWHVHHLIARRTARHIV
jgi:tellurite methyltransferase